MLSAVLLVLALAGSGLSCSYDDADLINWDSASAWENSVPAPGEYAVIQTGKHVRLNVSPKDLKGITIEEDASLVWGNFDNLTVTTDFIHIKGKFVIGDSDCPFNKNANIKLTGQTNTDNTVTGFGMKFIGVAAGGTIELHGAVKKTWSKLIQSMPAAADTCGNIFDFKSSDYFEEFIRGLFVLAFNTDGSVFDFGVFQTQNVNDVTAEDKFKEFVEAIPDEKILVIAVNADLGTGTATRNWQTIYDTVEAVSGINPTLLKNVQGREAYALIMKTGDDSSATEAYMAADPLVEKLTTDRLSFFEESTNIEFSVVGIVHASDSNNRGLEIKAMSGDVAFPVIKLNDDVTSWNVGDEIVVVSTDFDGGQTEEFTIIDCGGDCADNEVKLDHAFEFLHYGEVTQGVDERAEVGVLTQSIKIEGVMEDECYHHDDKDEWLCGLFNEDTHGGHLKIVRGFEAAHIEHVELFNMGQQKFLGSYALHFHMCDEVQGNWFRDNSIHRCHSRCVTIHGTDYAEVSGNLCYGTKGHSMFLEDSCEQHNVFDGNLAIDTRHGTHLLSDMRKDWVNNTMKPHVDALSTYWITHPNNIFRNNVAVASSNVGYWFLVANEPLAGCGARQAEFATPKVPPKHAFHSKIAEFDSNVAHSCNGRGLRIDHRISNGELSGDVYVPENGIFGAQSSHTPRNPPESDGEFDTSYMRRFTAYKNKFQNVWTKAGNLVMEEFSLADSPRGVAMARVGGNAQTYTEITRSLLIGESDNKGLPKAPYDRSYPGNKEDALQGVKFYQGPGYVSHSFLDKFEHKYTTDAFRPAGAVSFKQSSPYPAAPNSGARNISYGFCDAPDTNWVFQGHHSLRGFGNRDGNRAASFYDYDGSVTGTVGAQVVQSNRFFTTDRCDHREDWNMHVCPYEYARAKFSGKEGAFLDDYAMYMTRDDRPNDPFALIGERGDNYLVIKNMSYIVNFNGTTPESIDLQGENLQTGDYIRVGYCLPPDATFTLSSSFPRINNDNPVIVADSIEDLDADTTGRAYFWDSANGSVFVFTGVYNRWHNSDWRKRLVFDHTQRLLFVKVIGWSPVIDHENCPGYECPRIKVTITGGTSGIYDCYDAAYASGLYTKTEDSTSPIPTAHDCTTDTFEGYGAPVEANRYSTEEFNPSCAADPPTLNSQYMGCFKDTFHAPDLPFNRNFLSRSMTMGHCVKRCYQHNRAYAAVNNGNTCFCGDFYGAFEETPNDCTKTCTGDSSTKCGANNRISVYSTGVAAPADLTTCGPNNEGAVINNRCYYLTSESGTYTDGQRACVKLGGNLATITSYDIQYGVEQYMRGKGVDAWFGLNDVTVEGDLEYIDGTPVGSYDNTFIGQGDTESHDGYTIQANMRWGWNDRTVSETRQALCEMALDAQPPAATSCGTDNNGQQFGSGLCLAVINVALTKGNAEYACYTRLGSLVSVTEQNKADVQQHIYMYGDSMDYWTADVDDTGEPYELDDATLYNKKLTTSGNMNGVVCEIETLSASKRCADEWELSNDMCYLYTARWAGSYDKAVDTCNQGSSSILISSTEQVTNDVSTLVNAKGPKEVYAGLKYDAAAGDFEWNDGTAISWTNWRNGHGASNLANGECMRVRTASADWKNRDCTKGGHIVCQTAAAPAQ